MPNIERSRCVEACKTNDTQFLQVAIAVIYRKDKILIAKRKSDVHQGGKWEFPGGKINTDETILDALERECFEELNIGIQKTTPLLSLRHSYLKQSPALHVQLHVYKVSAFSGKAIGKEKQMIKWVVLNELDNYQFPAANKAIIQALKLPEHYIISSAQLEPLMINLQQQEQFDRQVNKRQQTQKQNKRMLKLIQIRCEPTNELLAHLNTLFKLAVAQTVVIQINSRLNKHLMINNKEQYIKYLKHYQSDKFKIGLHLTQHDLYAQTSIDRNNELENELSAYNGLISASCHNLMDIQQANRQNIDFIVLSPVNKTQSHPDAEPMGWDNFEQLCNHAQMPVYALGGMIPKDNSTSIKRGAQGIAGISFIDQFFSPSPSP